MAFFASPKTIINRYLTIGMCLVSSYYFLNFKFDNSIFLWLNDNQWSKGGLNELFKNGIAFWWIVFMLLSYSVFYIFLPLVMGLISSKLYEYIENKIRKFGIYANNYKRAVSFISNKKISKIFGKKAIDSLTISDRENFSQNINNIVCYLSHFLCCWILLGINNSWQIIVTIILTTLIVLIFNIIFYPITHIFNIPFNNESNPIT